MIKNINFLYQRAGFDPEAIGRTNATGIRGYFVLFFVALISFSATTSPAAAQYLAWPPSPRDEGIMNCATEECIAYVSWAGTGEYDRSANPTEAYLGQAEIQESIGKLKAAILKAIRKNVPPTAISQAILANDPELFLKQPGAIFLSALDIKNEALEGAAVIKLGDLTDQANAIMKAAMAEAGDVEFNSIDVEGSKCYSISAKDAPEIQFGIVDNYFIVSVGDIKIADVRANMKTPAPKWLKEIDDRIAIERPAFTVYLDLKRATELALEGANELGGQPEKDMQKFLELDKILALTKFESLQYQSGMNADGFNQVFHVNHSTPNEGILTALTAETLDTADISEIPEETGLAAALRLDVANIFSMVKNSLEVSEENTVEKIDEFESMVKDRFDIDLQKDLINALDGTVFFYSDTSLTSPKALAAVKVKDPKSFPATLDKLNQQLKKQLAASGQELAKVEKQGQTYFEAPLPTGMSVCYGLVDDRLYICNTVRGITSHLRKRNRDHGMLIQTPRYQSIIEESKSKGFDGLIGFNDFNTGSVLETGLPMVAMMLQGNLDRETFDFTFEDLPNVGVLINGLRPSSSVIYRTNTGFAMRMKNDLPIGYDVTTTGILIGMLLPAVQQVRAAARRVTSQNNLRQLALALLNYESVHGHLPPAYSTDADGNPLLSWRVEILPFLEENDLYKQFHLDEPWDSPHNIKLAQQMPEFYMNPQFGRDGVKTVYVAPVSSDSALSDGPVKKRNAGNSYKSLADGSANIVLVFSASEANGVTWTAPEDLRVEDLGDDELMAAANSYLGNFTSVYCDGSTHTINSAEITPKQLRGSFNKSDGISLELSP